MYCSYFMTRYGSGSVYATDLGVVKVEIPDLSRYHVPDDKISPEFGPSRLTALTAQMLLRYFQGECVDFTDTPVFLDVMTPFRQNVLNATRLLKYGEISTYGQIACECASPHAARAVGGALASNPVPIVIPCHRVVASAGRLTGFSAPGGENTKMALLKMEGVEFKGLLVDEKWMVMHRRPRE